MGVLLFLLVCVGLVIWLVVRSVRAGYGKLIFWLAWLLGGFAVVLQIPTSAPAGVRFLVQMWAYSIPMLPLWWTIQAVRRRHKAKS